MESDSPTEHGRPRGLDLGGQESLAYDGMGVPPRQNDFPRAAVTQRPSLPSAPIPGSSP